MKKLFQQHTNGAFILLALGLLLPTVLTAHFLIQFWAKPEARKSHPAAEKVPAEAEQRCKERKADSCQKVISQYEEALVGLKANGDKQGIAATLRKIGETYNALDERQKAIKYFNQALLFYREIQARKEEGEILNDLGLIHLYQGNSKEALQFCNEALEISREVGNRSGEADALNKVGEVHYHFGDLQKSLSFDYQALQIWTALNHVRGQAQTHMHLGEVYSDLSETEKASSSFGQALHFWSALKDMRGQAEALTASGILHCKLGERQEALNLLNQARPLFQAIEDKTGEARTLNGLGYVYDESGDKQNAIEHYEQALRLYRLVGLRKGEAGQRWKIGEAYFSLGESQRALDHLQDALSMMRELGDQRLEAYALRDIGIVYDSWGNTGKALDYFTQALTLNRTGKDRRQEAYTLNDIGQLLEKAGKTAGAVENYQQALSLSQATGDCYGESLTLFNLAHALSKRGDVAAARLRLDESLKIAESVRAKVASQDLRTSYFASIHQRYEFYTDLLQRLHQQTPEKGFAAAALEANERARARSTVELLAEARANIRQGANPELLSRERSLRQLLNDKAERQSAILNRAHSDQEAAAISREIQELTTTYDQVKAQIRSESPRYAALTQPQPSSLKEIQQLLDDETLLLEYALGNDRSYLWVVTPTGLNSYLLPGRAKIEKAARAVHELLSPPDSAPARTEKQRIEEYWRTATALSEMILKPVAAQLGHKRLLVVADGILQYIPFGALPIPESGPMEKSQTRNPQFTPLIVEHEIINLPSASTLAVLRRQTAGRKPAPKAVAVLADPVFETDDMRVLAAMGKIKSTAPSNQVATNIPILRGRRGGSFIRLPATQNEAKAIEEVTSAADRLVARGFEASLAKVSSSELSQFRIIHFATHGILDRENPELSAIVLSLVDRQGNPQNGYLRLHDIYNLNLPAELVVLSACDTGLGKEFKGEGLVGLTRGFMYAGASRVMASLWKVEDEPTAKLMKLFYQHMLKDNMSPAAALRQAQIALWQDAQWHAPYFWAAFTLQGEWK